jgi:hypothetical protein
MLFFIVKFLLDIYLVQYIKFVSHTSPIYVMYFLILAHPIINVIIIYVCAQH